VTRPSSARAGRHCPRGSWAALRGVTVGPLHALAEDFREHGVEAIRIMRIERPAEYVKVVASLMPNELLHSGSDGDPVQFARVEHVIVQVEHQPRLIEHEASDTQTQVKSET
jgi:hypothetical protein